MNKTLGHILRIALAALCAFAVLNAFCFWYFNPTSYLHDDARATDTIREPDTFTSRAKEGMAWATIDANGYNNGPAVAAGSDDIAVLMMGSSHTEALNVMQDESASYLLNNLVGEELDGTVYNIGMSSHKFARNAANLGRALERFAPSKYVVVETASVEISAGEAKRALNDSYTRIDATDIALPELVYKQPFVKAAYRQIVALNFKNSETEDNAETADTEQANEEGEEDVDAQVAESALNERYVARIARLVGSMRETAETHGVKLIVFYHPHLIMQADGSAASEADPVKLASFAAGCEQAGVTFVDMTDAFMQAFDTSRVLPHGFANTAPGVGHLNPEGHRMIADALQRAIEALEGGADANAASEIASRPGIGADAGADAEGAR